MKYVRFGLLRIVLPLLLLQAVGTASAAAATCPASAGTNTCTIPASADAYTDELHPATNFGSASTLQSYEDPANRTTRHLWLTFPTAQLPAGATVKSATLQLWATTSAPSGIYVRETSSAGQCPEASCTWKNEGPLNLTASGASSGAIAANSRVSAPITTPSYIKVASVTSFRVRAAANSQAVNFSAREAGQATAPQLVVTYTVPAPAPTSGSTSGSSGSTSGSSSGSTSGSSSGSTSGSSSGSGSGSSSGTGACASSFSPSGGVPFCLAGQSAPSAVNQPLPASPALDSNSASIVTQINSGQHNADFSEFGTTVDSASSGTTSVKLHCTETSWGTCGLEGTTVSVDPSWHPSWGSDHALVVVDQSSRKVYDLWDAATTSAGALAVSNGTLSVGWGGLTSLDGNGQSLGATGSGLSHLFGMVRMSEMANAETTPATAIPHALHFSSEYTCSAYRYPALKSDGNSSGNCIPEGARVFLDSSADCSTVTPAGSEAVCYALQRYGAYDTDTGGSAFAMGFQGDGTNDVPAVYSNAGFAWDYYDMKNIPWSHLHVADNCQCTGG